jgi:hypothetical protein
MKDEKWENGAGCPRPVRGWLGLEVRKMGRDAHVQSAGGWVAAVYWKTRLRFGTRNNAHRLIIVQILQTVS